MPPPVDPAALPTPAGVNTMPYVVNNAATRQTGPVEQQAPCQQQVTSSEQDLQAEPAAQQLLRIRRAQEFATGRGQLVAVIDSGVQPHPRLLGRLTDGGDYIENRSGLFDCDGHGTVVAGLIAAAPDAATGFVGVAPAAQILSIRQASTFYSVPLRRLDTGQEIDSSSAGDTVSMAQAVMRAVQLGATVINISEAACFQAKTDQDKAPDLQAAVHYAVEHDVVVVVAAANTSPTCKQNSPGAVTTISSPGWFDDDVLTVAATDDSGEPAYFSLHGPWVDVAAPGIDAVSLAAGRPGLTGELVDAHGMAHALDGTSFATPYVSGLAALVRERFKNLTARQVMHRIERTARHTAGRSERSEETGYGMIDPVAALTAVLPEERVAQTQPVLPTRLDGLSPPAPEDTLPRTVALAGSAAALGVLGLTMVVVQTIKRQRQRPG
ncbi:MAG: type VII secretion-associated serine protease mycosin [Pseudonocardiales bacterium]|nr:type VII secretion-associated serine protease mycosin [Pseudonocardiales bacterium]